MKVLLLGLLFLSSIAGFASENMAAGDCTKINDELLRTNGGSVGSDSSDSRPYSGNNGQ